MRGINEGPYLHFRRGPRHVGGGVFGSEQLTHRTDHRFPLHNLDCSEQVDSLSEWPLCVPIYVSFGAVGIARDIGDRVANMQYPLFLNAFVLSG